MTRINVVPVESLTGPHLVAEYRELPRVFALAYKHYMSGKPLMLPTEYTLGRGHVLFFYDKLAFLAKRQESIVAEMQRRGYKPTFTTSLFDEWQDAGYTFAAVYWNDYTPTPEAIALNQERINKRLAGDKS